MFSVSPYFLTKLLAEVPTYKFPYIQLRCL